MTTLKINNPTVEQFLSEQAKQSNTSTSDYLVNLLITEIEAVKVKSDMNTLASEIKKVNQGELKLKSAHSLINEL